MPTPKSGQPVKTPLQMADIARLAGVSESTVSRALADNPVVSARTRAHVQKIARDAGYRINPIARSLRSRRTGIISVAVPLVHERGQHLSDPFMMTMLALLADELTERGYSMLLTKVAHHQDDWVEQLVQSGHADGVILIGQSFEHDAINAAASKGLPVVAWGAQLRGQRYVSVGSDNRRGGELAAEHLLAQGRRQLAFLGDERLPEVSSRFQGFQAVLKRHRLTLANNLHVRTGFDPEEAYRAMKGLLAKGGEPDGVFAVSDVIAISAIRALREQGRRVPQDVSVMGFDDIAMASYSHPSLTTIRQEFAQGAALLVERVLAAIAGQPGQSAVIAPRLIVRESA